MKHQVLFSPIYNEKVFMNVVCCSRDWLFKGYGEEWEHFQGKQPNFHFCLPSQWGSTLRRKSLLLLEQILSFESRSSLKLRALEEKQTGSPESCSPLKRWQKTRQCTLEKRRKKLTFPG